MIVNIANQHCKQIAELHQKYLPTHFQGSTGQRLLQIFYATLAASPGGTGFTAIDGNNVIGYICGVWDLDGIIQEMLKKNWYQLFSWGILHTLANPVIIRSLFDKVITNRDSPVTIKFDYELRPIVVAPIARGTGIAYELVQSLLKNARSGGFPKVNLITEETNLAAIAFYQKTGFKDCGSVKKRGVSYKIYEILTNPGSVVGTNL